MSDNLKLIEQLKAVTKSQRVKLVLGLYFLLISAPFTIFLGAGIGVISIAIYFTILWLFPYWQPAYTLMYLISGNKDVSPILERHDLKTYHYINLGIKIIFLLFLFYSGIRIILERGFCELNPFC
jgi:hypothetical protein